MRRIPSILWLYLCYLQLLASPVIAQVPELHRSYPLGAKQGSSTKLSCFGKRLQGAKTLLFYNKGITVSKPEVTKHNQATFPIRVAKDAPLGEYLYRVQSDHGLSELRSFWVGPYPEIYEKKESNNSLQEAQPVTINRTIVGQTTVEDLDYYKINLKQGQVLSMELEGMRLGRVFNDPFIAVYDSKNNEIVSSDDSTQLNQDPRLSLKAPADGEYFIMVRDSSYQGNSEARYRLHLGNFIFVKSIYPLGAQIGKSQTFSLETEHEGTVEIQKHFKAPPELQPGSMLVSFHPAHPSQPHRVAPSPQSLRVTDFAFMQEQEPNNGPKHSSQAIAPSLPIAFHGSITAENDIDWFRFKAKKGQRIRARTYARSLGSPIDTAIQIRLPDGKYISNNDDASQGDPDSKLEYTIPKDGEYWVNVRDQLKRFSKRHHYRLEITTIQPAVTATLAHKRIQETQRWKTFTIPQGGKACHQINLAKSNFRGELSILVDSLPEGVVMKQLMLIKQDSKAILHLEASPQASIAASLHQFRASSDDGKIKTPVKSVVYPFLESNNRVFHAFHTDQIAIAVTPPSPYRVELIQPTQPIVQSGTIAIPIRVHRAPHFDKDIHLEIPWKPAGISASYSIKIPKGKSEAVLHLAANGNCPVGKWDMCVRAISYTKLGPIESASNIIKIEVKPPYLSAKLDLAATTRGSDTSIICKFTHHTAFAGKARLSLHGLPDGIIATPVEINKDTKEIAISITVPDKARIGKHGNLFCRVLIPQGKLIIPHTVGQGGSLRVNPPPKKKTSKQTASKENTPQPDQKKKKPLSRLEELRQKEK